MIEAVANSKRGRFQYICADGATQGNGYLLLSCLSSLDLWEFCIRSFERQK